MEGRVGNGGGSIFPEIPYSARVVSTKWYHMKLGGYLVANPGSAEH